MCVVQRRTFGASQQSGNDNMGVRPDARRRRQPYPISEKGAKVFVRGNLSAKPYQDKNGQWCVGINVSASEVQLCGLKNENNPQSGINDPFGGQPGGYNAPC